MSAFTKAVINENLRTFERDSESGIEVTKYVMVGF